jgi:hypothetical protein
MKQRFTFNQVASVYRTARPDYPEALIDDVLSYACLKPNDAILEVGCGSLAVFGHVDASGLFGPVENKCYPWKWRHATSSYPDFLRTRSDHRMLAPAKREELLDEIAKAIDGHGGAFDADYETHLYMARRVDRDVP